MERLHRLVERPGRPDPERRPAEVEFPLAPDKRADRVGVGVVEVNDLTIDCNLSGQSGSSVAAGAVRVLGNHTRVAKVSVINWGTKSADNTDQRKRQRANLES